jgi:hypothetical protein
MKDANAPRSELSSKRTSQVTVGPPRWSTFSSKNGEDDKDDDACCFDGDRLPLAGEGGAPPPAPAMALSGFGGAGGGSRSA